MSEQNEKLILTRIGEIALKGLNKRKFVQKVMENLRRRLDTVGRFKVYSAQSRIWAEPLDEASRRDDVMLQALDIACRVFGIVSASLVKRFDGGFDAICREAGLLTDEIQKKRGANLSFKVETKRGLKSFPMTSMEISSELGAYLLKNKQGLHVDVHEPDFIIYVEVREDNYIYSEIHQGARGLPVGTGGKGMLLLSGGIDSPVAGYMMASRGMELEAVYFHSYPFTSDEAKEKVIELARIVSEYCGRIKLHIVNFTEIQVNLRQNSPPEMMTITMRRIMMRIAERLAEQNGCKALITGESLGQVASQTLEALACTHEVADMPIFRPLIGIDKDFTVDLARKIGTFETSILPYEDCCTVFVAKHPKTKPSLADALKAESKLDIDKLVEEGLNKTSSLLISYGRREEDKVQ